MVSFPVARHRKTPKSSVKPANTIRSQMFSRYIRSLDGRTVNIIGKICSVFSCRIFYSFAYCMNVDKNNTNRCKCGIGIVFFILNRNVYFYSLVNIIYEVSASVGINESMK